MDPISMIGIGAGLIGSIGKLFGRKKANQKMEDLLAKDPTYTANPEAANRLGLAKTLLNARMPGAAAVERNIYGSQANTNAAVNRNATDSSQALAIAAGVGGQTNQAFEQQGINEANHFQQNYNNLQGAQEGFIQEGDKVFNDQVRRYGDEVSVRGAQNQNNQNNWGDVSNAGWAMADFGLNGGFAKKMRSGGQGGNMMQAQPANGTYGYQGWLDPRLRNRNTPNF